MCDFNWPQIAESSNKKVLNTLDFNLFLLDKQTHEFFKSIVSYKALDITNDYASLNDLDIRKTNINELDEMAIIFSSGTTSLMKPIVLSLLFYIRVQ